MVRKKLKIIYVLFILFLILSASISFSQFEPDGKPTPQTEEEAPPPSTGNSIFQPVPPAFWIRIGSFKTASIIIIILAFLLGFISYYIGYSAGGDINKKQIRKAILSALVIAIFARPIAINAHYYLGLGFAFIMPEDVAFGVAGFITYILWSLYLLAIPVYLYESFTVSAKEAYPVGRP
jgi:hypothetical protein